MRRDDSGETREAEPEHARDCGSDVTPKCVESHASNADLEHERLRMNKKNPKCVWFSTGGKDTNPDLAIPRGGTESPKHETLCESVNDSRCKGSNMTNVESERPGLFGGSGKSECVYSSAESEDTSPRRAEPNTRADGPRRANERENSITSKCRESDTRRKISSCAELRDGGKDSSLTASGAKGDDPARAIPEAAKAKPGQARNLGDDDGLECRKSMANKVGPEHARLRANDGGPVCT